MLTLKEVFDTVTIDEWVLAWDNPYYSSEPFFSTYLRNNFIVTFGDRQFVITYYRFGKERHVDVEILDKKTRKFLWIFNEDIWVSSYYTYYSQIKQLGFDFSSLDKAVDILHNRYKVYEETKSKEFLGVTNKERS